VTHERKGSQTFSRSEKIFNRRKKEKDRDNIAKINQTIEINANLWRLAEVGKLMLPENPQFLIMNDMEKALYRAELKVEQNWLQLKCGVINQDEQKQLLSEYMEKLLHTMPDVYNLLIDDEIRPSTARKIHDKVFPPKPMGFPAKR